MGRGFWEDRENHKLAIQHLGKELGIKKCNDWYTVMYDDFEEAGIISVLGFQEYKGSYAKCIIKNLPKCKLNESKFDRSFKYESGVHRIQRIPPTEINNRIHTSTATVAILPEGETTSVTVVPKISISLLRHTLILIAKLLNYTFSNAMFGFSFQVLKSQCLYD